MLKKILQELLVQLVPLCFNSLNVLLAGNLPPFGAACVVVEEQGRFLLVRQSPQNVSLPGGYMRWRESPMQAARRECLEETGLHVQLQEIIGIYSHTSVGFRRMSTLTVAYTGTVLAGGALRGSIEGQPCWLSETEMLLALKPHYVTMLDDYFHARKQAECPSAES